MSYIDGLETVKNGTDLLREKIRTEHRLDLEQAKVLATEIFQRGLDDEHSPELMSVALLICASSIIVREQREAEKFPRPANETKEES